MKFSDDIKYWLENCKHEIDGNSCMKVHIDWLYAMVRTFDTYERLFDDLKSKRLISPNAELP